MALVQRSSAPPNVQLPPEYMNIRMRKDEKFKDFYWRVRTLEEKLGFQPDGPDHQATIELWLSRLTANLFHKLRIDSKDTLQFETVYHLFERCCSIECQDRVNETRQMMSARFQFNKAKNWALFEAEVDKREKLLGYFDIDDPEELSERRRIDSWLVRLLPAELESLRLYANGLESIKTEQELLECLRQVEFGQKCEALVLNPRLSRYWWEIKLKNMAPQQEAATQSLDNEGKRQKSLAPGGHDGEQEQEATVPAVKEKSRRKEKSRCAREDSFSSSSSSSPRVVEGKNCTGYYYTEEVDENVALPPTFKDKSRRNKKSRHAQEEDEEDEEKPSPPAVKEKTQKRKKSHKIKEEVDEQVALPPVVEAKPRKLKKRVHFEDDDDEVEDPPPTFKDKARRRKSHKAEVDEEEAASAPVVKKKSRKGNKSRKAKEEEEEDDDDEQYISSPVVKQKSRKSKKTRRQVGDFDEQLASPPATKHKSRKRKRSHVEVDSDEAEADSSDVDEKPRKRKKILSERREKRRG
ncbi:hypothetical protein IWX90DRAFT_19073 [Phyllosticta citrichinensis]|uniref:Uncharacterized protein n=1 Tax=Phyllosticta citrichinensis TaxID=1130410 RepID=A0ABR1Y6J5_9PEZI